MSKNKKSTIFYEEVGPDGKRTLYFDPDANDGEMAEVRKRVQEDDAAARARQGLQPLSFSDD